MGVVNRSIVVEEFAYVLVITRCSFERVEKKVTEREREKERERERESVVYELGLSICIVMCVTRDQRCDLLMWLG